MEVPINIRISARHLHITEELYYKLFDHELTVKNELNQVGQFAANETVTLKANNQEFHDVRIVGPFRDYTQIEISKTDARILGLNPPVRKSGDVKNSEYITLATDKAEVTVEGCIIADRHVHFSPSDAIKYGVHDGQKLQLKIPGEKPGIIEVDAVVTDFGFFEAHLDTDDANAFLIDQEIEGTLII